MAYSIVNFVETDSGSVDFASFDAPNFTPAAGSALVAFIWFDGDAVNVPCTASDAVGNNDTWNEIGTGVYDGTRYVMRAFLLLNAANASTTVRITSESPNVMDYPAIAVVEVSGIVTSSALVGNAGQSQSSPGTGTDAITSGNTGTLTGQPAAVLAMVQNIDSDSTPAAGTGYTSQDSYRAWDYGGGVSLGGRFEHKRVTATTAVAGTFTDATNGGGSPYQTIVVALAESGGGVTNTDYSPGVGSAVIASFGPLVNPQIASPSADASDGNWTPSAGTNLYEVIDETLRSDTDYAQSGTNPSGDAMIVKLATISDPGTDDGLHLQWAAGAIGQTGQVVGSLRQGNSPGTEIAAWTHTNLPVGSYQEFDDALTSAQVANITDWSDLYLKVVAS